MKKGFTLIELLEIMVILAIVTLIFSPFVVDMIESSKRNSAKKSANEYIDAIESIVDIDDNNLTDIKMESGTYPVSSLNEKGILVEGTALEDGWVSIEEGKVKDYSLKVGKYVVSYNVDTKKAEIRKNGLIKENKSILYYPNGTIVYFNVMTGLKCSSSEYKEVNSTTGYNGINNKKGDQNSCLKFYAFNDNANKKTVSLLLDHNTTSVVAWNSKDNNKDGPSTLSTQLLGKLKEDTILWLGMMTPANYTLEQTNYGNYTIDYSQSKARLITANEIAKITGNKKFNEKTSSYNDYFYFDTNEKIESVTCKSGNTKECNYNWLYDRTSSYCKTHGCLNNAVGLVGTDGYWTATSTFGNTYPAWNVDASGSLNPSSVSNSEHYGVRPVIEILKTILE